MTISGLLVFSAAYVMATVSPGPAVAALMARVLARGAIGISGFIADCVEGSRLFVAALLLTLSKPKVILFLLALLPTVVQLDTLSVDGFAEIAALIVVILSAVLAGYATAATRARRLFTSPQAMRKLNRGTGLVMAGAAVTVATR